MEAPLNSLLTPSDVETHAEDLRHNLHFIQLGGNPIWGEKKLVTKN